MDGLYRLIYKSAASTTIGKNELSDILLNSLENNRSAGVTGALLATHSHFLHFLEGGFDEINETFFRITQDSRHHDIKLISFGPVEKQLFTQLKMKAFGIFELSPEDEQSFKEQYGVENNEVRLPVGESQALALLLDVELSM